MRIIQKTTSKKSRGINKKKYLIIHHTGGGTFNSMIDYLSKNVAQVSVHYVVGQGGQVAKIGEHEDILWHVGYGVLPGQSRKKNLNKYCIGIEVVSDGKYFTEKQKEAVEELIKKIISEENILVKNILRHADVSGYRGKWDIGKNFYTPLNWNTYLDRFKIKPKQNIKIKFNKSVIEYQIKQNSEHWQNLEHIKEGIQKEQKRLHKKNEDLRKKLK